MFIEDFYIHIHLPDLEASNEFNDVQSNQKMHDLYATKHIFQMALPDAF